MVIKKYFYKELVVNASKILIILLILLPVTELFKLIDQAISGNIPTTTLLTLIIYGTLASFPMVITIACFLTIVITINRYCNDHEFAIFLSSGLSAFYWLRATVLFILPLTIICAISSLYITPWATGKSQIYTDYLLKQEANLIITPGIFKENKDGNEIYYLENYSLSSGTAKNIFVQYLDNSKGNKIVNITAKEGRVINKDGAFEVLLSDGNRVDLYDFKNENVKIHFDSFKISVIKESSPIDRSKLEVSTLKLDQLIQDKSLRGMSELSWRISIPLMMFVMCMIAVPISIKIGRNQNNYVFILPPIIYAIYENIVLSLNGYINSGKITIYHVIFVHLLFFILTLLFVYAKTLPKGYFSLKIKK